MEGPALSCIEIISMNQLSDGGQIQWDRLAETTLTIQSLSGTSIDQYASGQQVALQVIPLSQADRSLVQQESILGQLAPQVTQSRELQKTAIKLVEDGSVCLVQSSMGDLSQQVEATEKGTVQYNSHLLMARQTRKFL